MNERNDEPAPRAIWTEAKNQSRCNQPRRNQSRQFRQSIAVNAGILCLVLARAVASFFFIFLFWTIVIGLAFSALGISMDWMTWPTFLATGATIYAILRKKTSPTLR